ncbi:CPBP family intramembrane glutamic endopeptidase [Couchioplanes caeruleus]|uniref:CPBP family intramembrane glutamic endopeptidase n=1 Tax=Couchioplanes caeruleus TaxID=56438 RepID=UPI001472EC2B|nr:CPBP family intramembrane glutamic endopeptidase [Couchioplanes caeruleus]
MAAWFCDQSADHSFLCMSIKQFAVDAERRPRTGWRILGYFVCWFALYGGVLYLVAGPEPTVVRNVIAHLVVVGAGVGVTAMFRCFVDRRRWRDIGLVAPDRRQLAFIAAGFAAGVTVVGLWFAVQLALGSAKVTGFELTERGVVGTTGVLAVGFLYYATSATTEEMAFRGYIFQNLRERLPMTWAVGLTGLLFASGHFIGGSAGPLHFAIGLLDFVLFSSLMILTRLRTGALWMAISFHAAWNWAQDYLFGVGVAGEDDYHNALVHVRLDGPSLLVGGPHNADTDLLTILLEVMLIIGYCWYTRARRPAEARS